FVVAPKRTHHRQSKDLEKGVGIERYGAQIRVFLSIRISSVKNANKTFTAISIRVKLRFQIPQRQEQTKRKLQFVLSVAANSTGFNRGRSAGFVRLALPRAPLVLPA